MVRAERRSAQAAKQERETCDDRERGPEHHARPEARTAREQHPAVIRHGDLDVRIHRSGPEVDLAAAQERAHAARLAPAERDLTRARRQRERNALPLLPERLRRAVHEQRGELCPLGQRDSVLPALRAAQRERERRIRGAHAGRECELAAVDRERRAAVALRRSIVSASFSPGQGRHSRARSPSRSSSTGGIPFASTCQSGPAATCQTSLNGSSAGASSASFSAIASVDS